MRSYKKLSANSFTHHHRPPCRTIMLGPMFLLHRPPPPSMSAPLWVCGGDKYRLAAIRRHADLIASALAGESPPVVPVARRDAYMPTSITLRVIRRLSFLGMRLHCGRSSAPRFHRSNTGTRGRRRFAPAREARRRCPSAFCMPGDRRSCRWHDGDDVSRRAIEAAASRSPLGVTSRWQFATAKPFSSFLPVFGVPKDPQFEVPRNNLGCGPVEHHLGTGLT